MISTSSLLLFCLLAMSYFSYFSHLFSKVIKWDWRLKSSYFSCYCSLVRNSIFLAIYLFSDLAVCSSADFCFYRASYPLTLSSYFFSPIFSPLISSFSFSTMAICLSLSLSSLLISSTLLLATFSSFINWSDFSFVLSVDLRSVYSPFKILCFSCYTYLVFSLIYCLNSDINSICALFCLSLSIASGLPLGLKLNYIGRSDGFGGRFSCDDFCSFAPVLSCSGDSGCLKNPSDVFLCCDLFLSLELGLKVRSLVWFMFSCWKDTSAMES